MGWVGWGKGRLGGITEKAFVYHGSIKGDQSLKNEEMGWIFHRLSRFESPGICLDAPHTTRTMIMVQRQSPPPCLKCRSHFARFFHGARSARSARASVHDEVSVRRKRNPNPTTFDNMRGIFAQRSCADIPSKRDPPVKDMLTSLSSVSSKCL